MTQQGDGAQVPDDLQQQARALNAQLQAARVAGLGERAEAARRIRDTMPPELAQRGQWLLWRLEVDPDRPGSLAKPLKTPYWTMGRRRAGQLGGDEDRRNLRPMEAALRAFTADGAGRWNGVGFAFLEGDGLIGIDLDWKDTGEPSNEQQAIMDLASSFCEWSPSGLGVHIIVSGQCDSFKHDDVGVEVYCGGRYFTVTGQRMESAPTDVRPIKPHAMAYMQQVVQGAKDRAKAAKHAAAPEPAAPARTQAPAPATPAAWAGGEKGDDFKRVNAAALESLDRWVLELFPKARSTPYGWRVTSKDLGRDLQEDLQLSRDGIHDFGEEDSYSAIDCVLRWAPTLATKPKDAMLWLAQRCGVQVQQRGAALRAPPAAAPAAAADEVAADEVDDADEVDGWDTAATAAALDGQGAAENAADVAHAPGEGGGGAQPPKLTLVMGGGGDKPKPRKKKEYPPEFWDGIDRMLDRYALVYGSNQVWDLEQARFIEVAHLRLACGVQPVAFWLASARRKMVNPEDLVFEPGVDVPEGKVNLFQGLKVAPVECTDEEVAPMLKLLRHLCATSVLVEQAGSADDEQGEGGRPDDVDAVMHWALCWCAYPHQHLGAKMRTALIFHGSQGTGKNLFFDAWRDTFGDLGKTVGQTELEEKYNAGWLSRTLAIVGDEVVSKAELYHNKNRLKMIVTQEHRFPIRAMHCDVRYETNHANVVFTSNEDMPLALEDRDRRYLVVYTPLEADTALYDEVKHFLQGDGVGKWLHYLQRYPLGEFDRHTKPLMTRAKQLLIEANWKPTQRFVAEWIGGYLDLPRRACSREQAFRAFRRWVENTGVKWAADQATFVREINRWANEQRVRSSNGQLGLPPFELRKVRMPDSAVERDVVKEVGDRKFVWMLIHLPGGPETGVNVGDWSVECMREFSTPLSRFCGHTGRPLDGDKDKNGGTN